MPPARTRAAECDRDPIRYANRLEDREFNPYAAVREMLAKLNAAVKGRE